LVHGLLVCTRTYIQLFNILNYHDSTLNATIICLNIHIPIIIAFPEAI